MAAEFDNFLLALAAFIKTRAAAMSVTLTEARDLWVAHAVEKDAADPYSLLRLYDGGTPYVPETWCSIQIETRAADLKVARQRAGVLYACFLDETGRPLRMAAIGNGFRINGLDLSAPAPLAVESNQKHRVVFNVRNCTFIKTA